MEKTIFKSGFTLVEALVAITVLLIGVIGPLNLATRGISDGISVKNRITAIYLAQEGLDLAMVKRDKNRKADDKDWRFGLTGIDSGPDCSSGASQPGCFLNIKTIVFSPCGSANDNCQLIYDTADGLYEPLSELGSHRGAIFTRRIFIDETQTDLELKVQAIVGWQEKGVPKSVSLTSYLYPR